MTEKNNELLHMLDQAIELVRKEPGYVAPFAFHLTHLEAMRKALAAPSASAQQVVRAFSKDVCADDVYERGQSIGLFDIPKETANAICTGISAATGALVDWHYVGGRVHMKALAAPAPSASPEPVVLYGGGETPISFEDGASPAALTESEYERGFRHGKVAGYDDRVAEERAASPADQGEDARDAARYRRIRNGPYSDQHGDVYAMTFQGDGDIPIHREELDRIVDAAMSASKERP